jgi:hypothetical protein
MRDKNSDVKELLTQLIDSGEYGTCARESHDVWRAVKVSQGWTYGLTRDNESKTNPYIVDFEQLPAEMRGQNSLTPYAVFNFIRTEFGEKSLSELEKILETAVEGGDPELMDKMGEYIHSHFVAAQLAKGETAVSRKDMVAYESLDRETQSWDTSCALGVVKYLLESVVKR